MSTTALDLWNMTKIKLQQLARDVGVSDKGTKSTLIRHILMKWADSPK